MRYNHCMRRITILIALAALLAACTGPAEPAATPARLAGAVKVGAIVAANASSTGQGIALAQAQINAQSYLGPGVTLDVRTAADGGQKEAAINAAYKFINGDLVTALLGPDTPFTARSVAPMAQAAAVPVITFADNDAQVTDPGPFVFRTTLPESQVITEAVHAARQAYDVRQVAILYDVSDGYTTDDYHLFAGILAAQGVKVVATESFIHGETDLSAELGRIRDAHPDALVLSANVDDAASVLSQARGLGLTVPVVGGNALNGAAVARVPQAPPFVMGVAWCACYNTGANAGFVEAYRTRFGVDPDQRAAQSYTATWLLAMALKRAGSTERGTVRDALSALRDVETPLGPFTFDAARAPGYAPYIVQVKDGRFVAVGLPSTFP